MTLKTVWRDAQGRVINIGEWNYELRAAVPEGAKVVEEEQEDGSALVTLLDADGQPVEPEIVATNNPPEGATSAEENVVEGWDGGLYVAGDPRAER